ncbi:MAG: DNA mismatch repair endonuclease MutL [Rhodospirillales bacterium]|nr:DNA mismatch repair endonuclease MutL [Rhodospirillales bacterium]
MSATLERPRIRLLPDATIDRIAAGEVIERPAAALRELVENALDAGARRIVASITGGGITAIEVTDDGGGMSGPELALAVRRHATSKLADDDLVRIATLGFRGEALASIGAAARLAITSRRPGGEAASITVTGGVVSDVRPAAGAPGTRVLVEDLFFATPARRKFLKSTRSEADAAQLAVRRLALAAPGVAFRFSNDGETLFDRPGEPLAQRVAALLAPQAAIAFDEERDGVRVHGFAAPPAAARATAAGQLLCVNGRPVADPVLRTAVRVAYRDVIAAGRHAVVALLIEIDPESIDVNVHPAKAEVRFRDAEAVRGLVIGALRRALAGGARPLGPPVPMGSRSFLPRPATLVPPREPAVEVVRPGFAEARLSFAAAPAARSIEAVPPAAEHPLGAAVAQVLDTYIVAVAADGGLVLVDQHAAHERLTHESMAEQFRAGGVISQPLLLPAVVDLPEGQAASLLERAEAFARLGLEIEPFGRGAVLVRALPALLGATDPAPLLRDLADEIAAWGEGLALDARLDAAIARMACHGSIRAGRRLAGAEMDALLRRMEATPRAATCSHGRPTFLKFSRSDLEKMFGRQ